MTAKCPKCGADPDPRSDSFERIWNCGTTRVNKDIDQSDSCRIAELEAKLAEWEKFASMNTADIIGWQQQHRAENAKLRAALEDKP